MCPGSPSRARICTRSLRLQSLCVFLCHTDPTKGVKMSPGDQGRYGIPGGWNGGGKGLALREASALGECHG